MQQPKTVNLESRKRKMLLLLPLFFLPFVILLFYSLHGGGKKDSGKAQQKGINQDLPAAQVDDNKKMDKMSLYREADRDSVKRSYPGKDPFTSLALTPDTPATASPASPFSLIGSGSDLLHRRPEGLSSGTRSSLAENEQKVQARLATLQQMVNSAKDNEATPLNPRNPASPLSSFPGQPSPELTSLGDTPKPDPELKQLNDMLEKVLDVQHPERVKERMLETSAKEPSHVMAVTTLPEDRLDNWPAAKTDTPASRIAITRAVKAAHRFYELDESATDEGAANTIPAVVHETRTVVTGGSVKLRLTSAVVVGGHEIPAGTTVEGKAELSGERLKVSVDKIVTKGSIIPVKLSVYDLSGLEGIYEPGAISRDASKQGADQALQSMQLATLNPSLGAQAAASGIETVKTLLSKKVRLITVTVKAGSPVLLYSQHNGE